MSTYIYLVCDSHNPPLWSEGEVGQHLYDIPTVLVAIAHAEEILQAWSSADIGYEIDGATRVIKRLGGEQLAAEFGAAEWGGHFATNTLAFLHQHRRCVIGLTDEYHRRYDPETGEAVIGIDAAEDLVEDSSLGTPSARAARDSVDDEIAARIVDRAAALDREAEQ